MNRMIDAQYGKIGERLVRLRAAFGSDMSQRDWALRNGFNPTQYNNWEVGTRRISLENAELLCDRYGLTLDWIYRGREDGVSEMTRKVLSSK